MKVLINIPTDFERHFYLDKFDDSLKRIQTDVKSEFRASNSISGNYELELIDMLIKAFKNAMVTIVATDVIHKIGGRSTDRAYDIELSAGYQAYEEFCEG